MTDFPTVRRINAELEQIDAFKYAHAHRQPDTPPEFRMYY